MATIIVQVLVIILVMMIVVNVTAMAKDTQGIAVIMGFVLANPMLLVEVGVHIANQNIMGSLTVKVHLYE